MSEVHIFCFLCNADINQGSMKSKRKKLSGISAKKAVGVLDELSDASCRINVILSFGQTLLTCSGLGLATRDYARCSVGKEMSRSECKEDDGLSVLMHSYYITSYILSRMYEGMEEFLD